MRTMKREALLSKIREGKAELMSDIGRSGIADVAFISAGGKRRRVIVQVIG